MTSTGAFAQADPSERGEGEIARWRLHVLRAIERRGSADS
jgi:hypothetical protein